MCSPSVLDRLNPLLEPNGVLTIDERGIVDGCIPTVRPHPDFRYIIIAFSLTQLCVGSLVRMLHAHTDFVGSLSHLFRIPSRS